MAGGTGDITAAAQLGFAAAEAEIDKSRALQLLSVQTQSATGSGDMNELFAMDRRFRLVFVRCHCNGGVGTAPLVISVDSALGAAHDTRLFTMVAVGTGEDVNFRITAEESAEPSAWTLQPGDQLRAAWTNPDSGNMTWGLEIGLALAS